jgi:radical SAM enzyme (TIGR01210 family)
LEPAEPSPARSAAALTRWVRERRPAKLPIEDPFRPLATFKEEERLPGGGAIDILTLILAGAECPFTCVYCDLWRQTLDGPTPPGAIPAQIRTALAEHAPFPGRCAIKLYNASNFFEPKAVPPEDDAEIAALVAPFERVTVECHPRLVGAHFERSLAFAARLEGKLEVAMGLETVHPEALPKLNKGMTLEDFDRAARTLREAGVALRAFVLLGAPFVPKEETVAWTLKTVAHALEGGASHVSIIPVREGNGAMEELRRGGDFTPPTLGQLEEALERGQALEGGRGVVTADLWEAERFAECPACAGARLLRLAEINRAGEPRAAIDCTTCPARRSREGRAGQTRSAL